jgi:hypothetical protein
LAEGEVVAGEVVEAANGDDAAAGSNVDGDASSVDDPNNLSAEDIAEAAAGELGETQSFRWDNEWMPFGEKAPLGYRSASGAVKNSASVIDSHVIRACC